MDRPRPFAQKVFCHVEPMQAELLPTPRCISRTDQLGALFSLSILSCTVPNDLPNVELLYHGNAMDKSPTAIFNDIHSGAYLPDFREDRNRSG